MLIYGTQEPPPETPRYKPSIVPDRLGGRAGEDDWKLRGAGMGTEKSPFDLNDREVVEGGGANVDEAEESQHRAGY